MELFIKKQRILDWLFRIKFYKGIEVQPPDNLIELSCDGYSQFFDKYTLILDTNNELGYWLEYECEGPWKIKLKEHCPYIFFARLTDAMLFKLKIIY